MDAILLDHETYSLVKDEVAAEEQTPIKVKGFAEPIRCYKVQGLYDQLDRDPRGAGRIQVPPQPAKAPQSRGHQYPRRHSLAPEGVVLS